MLFKEGAWVTWRRQGLWLRYVAERYIIDHYGVGPFMISKVLETPANQLPFVEHPQMLILAHSNGSLLTATGYSHTPATVFSGAFFREI